MVEQATAQNRSFLVTSECGVMIASHAARHVQVRRRLSRQSQIFVVSDLDREERA
jgi:hypothetical protein